MNEMKTRRPGRPRDEEVGAAILDAARTLVLRHGYEAVTTRMIADAASAGKQTLYRRWPSKAELVLEAFLEHAKLAVDLPATEIKGKLSRRITSFLELSFAALNQTGPALRGLMAVAQADAEFLEAFRTRFIAPRRAALGALLQGAIARGELPTRADTDTAVIMLFGALWYRLLLGETLDRRLAERLAALTINGLATTPGCGAS